MLDCPRYSLARVAVHEDAINATIRDPGREASAGDKDTVVGLGRYLKKIWEERFPNNRSRLQKKKIVKVS